MRKISKYLSLALVLVMALVTVTACGNRGGADGNHSQGVTDDAILIGNTAATSGALAFVGAPFVAGMQAYLDIVNAAGGVHGRQIEFIHIDDGFEAPRGIAATHELIHDRQVFALVGHFGTPTISATLPEIFEVGIPAVYFASGISQLHIPNAATVETGQRIFPVQPIFGPEGYVLVARALSEYNVTTLGIIHSNDEAGQDMLQGARNQAAQFPAVSVVEAQVTPEDPVSVASAVLAMQNAGVDVIVAATIQNTFPLIVSAMAGQGVSVPVFTSYVSADATTIALFASDYLGAGANFPVYATAWLDIFDPNDPEAFHPDTLAFMAGVGPEFEDNAFAMAGWTAANMFIQGLRLVDSNNITWENLTTVMENNLIEIPMGGTMDFSNGQRTGTTSMTLNRADVAAGVWTPHRPFALLSEIVAGIN
ncbi:MAG: ABC transporter substrate-binding protein [Defluviitaleaceae bacterium]|nr:ABC transporter substrate-binding protein [Defluviitaleaceae bacterium]